MSKKATLYRMATEAHLCPFGLKAKALLERQGYVVEDHLLKSREEVDAFKQKHHVDTTPQVFIEGTRIGGYEDLLRYFNKSTLKQQDTTYQPIIAIFSVTLLMAMAVGSISRHGFGFVKLLELFISISMCVLGIMKLRDLYRFTTQFITYDLLARRWLPYAYVYPFVETGAGVLMIAHLLTWLSAPAAFFIGAVGSVSVFKAVYLEKRDLKCACVGGDSSVPLGFISLTENVMMIVVALWMFFKIGL